MNPEKMLGYYDEVVAITPADGTRFDAYDSLYVASEGDIKIQPVHGSPVTIPVNVAPVVLPFRVVKVFSTGTTVAAGNIFGLKNKRFIDHRESGQKYDSSVTPHRPGE